MDVMADRTDCLLTRDLMLEAVPCKVAVRFAMSKAGIKTTSSYVFFGQHLGDTGNLFLRSCIVKSVFSCRSGWLPVLATRGRWWRGGLTNDEGNHGRAISSGGFEALDQLLDLPDLDLKWRTKFILVN